MSKTMNREIRKKSRRESYLEQSPYNGSKKRKSLTSLHSYDDSDIAYQSAPEYLKRLMNTSISSNGHSVRSLTRTQSASEMIPGNNCKKRIYYQRKFFINCFLLSQSNRSYWKCKI
jgi:hypothetical protein